MRISIVVKTGRVIEVISDCHVTVDIYDMDCIYFDGEPEFNYPVTGEDNKSYNDRIKTLNTEIEEHINNLNVVLFQSSEEIQERETKISILKSIIEHNGDCEADNIFCAGCPLANSDWECQTPYITAEDRDHKETVWKQERLEAAKKLLQELEHGTTIQQ